MTADLRERLQSSLVNSYRLDRELGGGGMSRVFTATDTALGRAVVVKVLPPELAAGVSAERFTREIQLAARLQHPHIVPLLSAGEADGLPYFTMPFVEGESLRVRLTRRGELPVSESVRMLREIASALAYAHLHGVVHRDIKPDNVLFSGDVAMVADFGVAKALSASANGEPGDHGGVTSIGVALGTPAYMAPEQATADPSTDHRADVYAFGVLAYEVLTGQPPFTGRNPSQLLAAHVTEPPEAIARRRPNLPPALAALVMRCLEKRPADRPQSAGEIVHALDDITTPSGGMTPTSAALPAVRGALVPQAAGGAWPARRVVRARNIVIGIAALVVAGAGMAVWTGRDTASPPVAADSREDRIAVLPFENLGDSSDAYFADGITDAVRGKLTGLQGLQVIARASSVQYRGTTMSPRDIARELGVRYLLTGTVRWAKGAGGASHVQVSPELVEVAGDGAAASRWQQPFDAEMADVFRVQGEIAGKVAEAMRVAVGGTDEARFVEVPTRDPGAYDAFLRGEALYWTGAGATGYRRAIAEYERAVLLDSGYAVAWAGLARTRSVLYGTGVPTPELARQAREAADRALRLAPDAAFAHSALSSYFLGVEGDPARALPEAEKARAAAPTDPEIIARLAGVYSALGRYEDGLQSARAAQRLDPRSSIAIRRLQTTLTFLRRYPEARQVADRALALAPSLGNIQSRITVSLCEGDLVGARRVLRDAGERVNQDELAAYMAYSGDLGWVLDDAGRRRLLALGPELYDNDRASWALVRAQVHGWLGDPASARAWGDSAAREFAAQLRVSRDDAQRHSLRGVALAYAGRRSEALAEGRRGLALAEGTDLYNQSYMQSQLIRVYLLIGEHDKALDLLEPMLARPDMLSPGWLGIDPTFAPLKGNPRFEKLRAGQ